MKRNGANLKKYRETCRAVLKRSSGVCEIIVDGERCKMYIGDNATWTNFAHKATRNGMSDEEVIDPDNIWLSCASHHAMEEATGKRMEGITYDDPEQIVYVPDEN